MFFALFILFSFMGIFFIIIENKLFIHIYLYETGYVAAIKAA